MRNKTPLIVIPVVLLLTACGGTGTTASNQGSEDPVVHITATEFSIEADRTSFRVGVPYEFEVTNDGDIAHEVMLMPVMSGDGMSMEQMDEVALGMAEEEDLVPGATVTFTVTFDEEDVGTQLEFACHITDHYGAGMHLPITVTEGG